VGCGWFYGMSWLLIVKLINDFHFSHTKGEEEEEEFLCFFLISFLGFYGQEAKEVNKTWRTKSV
jgi:hypothetical protein